MRLEKLNAGAAILRHIESNETKNVAESQLVHAILDGKLILVNADVEQVRTKQSKKQTNETIKANLNYRQETRKAIDSMVHKRAWIDALSCMGIERIVDKPWVRTAMMQLEKTECKDIQRFSITTLSNAVRQINKFQGDWSQLVPRYSMRGGAGKTRIDMRAEKIIEQVIEDLKVSRGRIVKVRICQTIRQEIATRNIALVDDPIQTPGDMTIARRVNEQISAYDISKRNDGEKFARRKYRANANKRIISEIPLMVSEYDDMDAEVYLVDQERSLPVGRAYLTHGVDQSTGVPLGFDLSHQPRSFESAIGAICNSLLPKDMKHPDFQDCKNYWFGFGAQGQCLLDNAKYNFAKATRHQAEAAGLLLAGARPYGPTEKSAIEHFNHVTKQDFCPDLPGYRGRKDDPDAIKHGLKSAIIDESLFKRLYTKWVTDVYLINPQIDGYTPREKWEKYFSKHSPAVRWSAQEVAFLRLKPEERGFRESGGILSLRLPYFNDELHDLKKRLGTSAKVYIYKDTKDLSYVYVMNPFIKQLFKVPCTLDLRYTKNLTEYQQKQILKICRLRKMNHPSMKDLIEARNELMLLVKQASKSSKLKTRQIAVRTGDISASEEVDDDELHKRAILKQTKSVVMTALEFAMLDIEEEALESIDEDWGAEE